MTQKTVTLLKGELDKATEQLQADTAQHEAIVRQYDNITHRMAEVRQACEQAQTDAAAVQQENREAEKQLSEAMETLRKIEFAIVDVALYLNAYPDSDCALAYYRKLIGERECLLRKIHEECGPTTLYDNVSETCWKWTDGPWPWQQNGKEK